MANTLKFGNGNWATKEDSVLAYNDENNNFKPLPFDFTRASTATYVDSDGLIKTAGNGEPRIDYTDNTDGALLLEPSRSNYIPYSTLDFNGGIKPNGWSVGFGIGSYSYEQLTYKGQKAVKQTQITTGRSYLDTGAITILANTEHTLKIQFILDECVADANDEIVAILCPGFNVIYRFSDIDENGVFELQYNPLSDDTVNIRIGLGCTETEDGGKSLAWAIPQLEVGSYPTSYIPTSGSAVTRVAENTTTQDNVPTTVIGQTSGVLYCNFTINNNPTSTRRVVIMSDGTANERIGISLGSNIIYAFIVDGGSAQCEIVKSSITSGNYKCAFAYNNNDFVFYVNGSQVGTDTSGTVPTCDRIDVGNQFGLSVLEGSINDIKLYNTALTDQELIALTQ